MRRPNVRGCYRIFYVCESSLAADCSAKGMGGIIGMVKRSAIMISLGMLISGTAAMSLERHMDVHHHRKRTASHFNYRKIAEAKGYKKVSSLVNFPDFFPGLGVVYVVPDTLPAGPFLSFDRRGRLVATIYM